MIDDAIICPCCDGSGEGRHEPHRCTYCKGLGAVVDFQYTDEPELSFDDLIEFIKRN